MLGDCIYALRRNTKRPGFSLAVILTLASGIGANTAAFSLINTVMLRPLPYADSDQLHLLIEQDSVGSWRLASYPTFLDWREQVDAFDGMAYVRGTPLTYQTEEQAGLLIGSFVSEEFFSMMGVSAAHGRTLLPEDFQPGRSNAIVLSDLAWRRWFGGDPGVIGRPVTIGHRSFTIVGLMPTTFAYPDWGANTDMWLPITGMSPADLAALRQRDFHADSRVVARLRSDVPLSIAKAQLDTVARRLALTYPEASAQWTQVAIEPLKGIAIRDVGARLFLLGGCAVVILLICCLNLANLYLVQGMARKQEYAIRAALGANRGRVVRQLLAESLLLAILGAAAGTVVAVWGVRLVAAGALSDLPRLNELRVDAPLLGFAAGLTVLTALLFAAVGARHAGSVRLANSFGGRGSAGTAGGRSGRVPAWLQTGQVSLSFILLIGAALLTQSFWRLSRQDPGFDPERLVLIRVHPPSPTYDDPQAATELYARVLESVAGVPGIQGVALTNFAPPSLAGVPTRAAISRTPSGASDDLSVRYRTVSAGYFSMLRIPIIEGREFDNRDLNGPAGPVIINATLARQWGGESAVDQSLGVLKAASTRADYREPLMGTVIGVVGDINPLRSNRQTRPVVYVPFSHNPWSDVDIVARAAGEAAPMLAAVENAVRVVDPAIPISGPFVGARTMDERLAGITSDQRFNAALAGAFAAIALVLAAVGMYGVIAYTVTLQTMEIGVRMALGAAPAAVLRVVLGGVTRILVVGLIVGVIAAFALSRLVESLLYQIEPTDPMTFLAVAGLLMLVGTIAGYLPARRAARMDPLIALSVG